MSWEAYIFLKRPEKNSDPSTRGFSFVLLVHSSTFNHWAMPAKQASLLINRVLTLVGWSLEKCQNHFPFLNINLQGPVLTEICPSAILGFWDCPLHEDIHSRQIEENEAWMMRKEPIHAQVWIAIIHFSSDFIGQTLVSCSHLTLGAGEKCSWLGNP